MIEESQSFTMIDGSLEPTPIPTAMLVPNEPADREYSPAPNWVADQLTAVHKREPYPKGRRHHVNVWELLVRRLPVTSQAKAVASVLAEHWPHVAPSLRRIVELTSLSRGSVDNGIYMLRAAGLVVLEPERGRRTIYRLSYPERAITVDEVEFVKRWRRAKRPEPAHVVGGSDEVEDGDTCPRGGRVPAHVVTPPAHLVGDTCPPGGREVSNEAVKQDMKASPGADAPDDDSANPPDGMTWGEFARQELKAARRSAR